MKGSDLNEICSGELNYFTMLRILFTRWRAFPNGPCSAPCGGGQQRLLVQCVREAALTSSPGGAGSSLFDDDVVADEFCNSTSAPTRTILCNLAPCAPTWSIDSWSEVRDSFSVLVQHHKLEQWQPLAMFQ